MHRPRSHTGRLTTLIAAALACVVAPTGPAAAQSCPADCSGDRLVTVDEIVSCVSIALGAAELDTCSACDVGGDGAVTVDEIIRSVNAALGSDMLTIAGVCRVPGASGLEPCPVGTDVSVARCDDREGCIGDPERRVPLDDGSVDASGQFVVEMQSCDAAGAPLLFEARPNPATVLRRIDFGGASARGSGAGMVVLEPTSEASTQLLDEEGLENFEDDEIADIVAAVDAANADTSFAGLSTDAAIDLAKGVARADTAVQELLFGGVRVSISTYPSPARAGETVTVVVTATNATAEAIDAPVLAVALPNGIDNFDATLIVRPTGVEALSCDGSGRPTRCDAGEVLTARFGTLEPGGGVSLALPPQFGSVAAPEPLFVATLSDSTATLATSTRSLPILDERVLTLSIDANPSPVAPGDPLTYWLTYGNETSGVVARDVVLRVSLPGASTIVDAGGGTILDKTVEWQLGNVSAGETGSVRVAVQVDASSPSGSLLRAEAAIADAGDNSAQAATATRVATRQPLQLGLELNPDPAQAGQVVLGRITAANTGDIELLEATAQILLPDAMDDIAQSLISAADFDCVGRNLASCQDRERLIWRIGTVEPGRSSVLVLPLIFTSASSTGSVTTLRAAAYDSSGSEATASESIRIESQRLLWLSVDPDVDPVEPGDLLTYRAHFGNPESTQSVARNALLTLDLPNGTTVESTSGDGAFDETSNSVTWALGNVTPGDSGTVEATVRVAPTVPEGTILRARATVGDDASNRTRATANVVAEGRRTLLLDLDVAPNLALPGTPLEAMLTIANQDEIELLGVQVEVSLPQQLNSFSVSEVSDPEATRCAGRNLAPCQARERLIWTPDRIGAGEVLTFTFPPTFDRASTSLGSLYGFTARATESQGTSARARTTVKLGVPDE